MLIIRKLFVSVLMIALIGVTSGNPWALAFAGQQDANEPDDFFDMSIEELMDVEITC